jgi:hypothetical protein
MVDIVLATDTPRERAARDQLRRLLSTYDLRGWVFTSQIRIEQGAIPHSHPVLTLNTRNLDDDDRALATFVHEQLHWWLRRDRASAFNAIAEVKDRWPEVPSAAEGGARSAASTWLHLVVCSLERIALTELLGPERARATLAGARSYAWVYRTLLADWAWLEALVERHGLVPPRTGRASTDPL